MRIDRLKLKNFTCFEDREFSFHPQFNLIIGVNGTGKTSLLNALSISMGDWYAGTDSEIIMSTMLQHYSCKRQTWPYIQRFIRKFPQKDPVSGYNKSWERKSLFTVEADMEIFGERVPVNVKLSSIVQTFGGDRSKIATVLEESMVPDSNVIIPLVLYCGVGRLGEMDREQAQMDGSELLNSEKLSRFAGYTGWSDPQLSLSSLRRWIVNEDFAAYQNRGDKSEVYQIAVHAMTQCLDGAEDVYYDAKYGEVVVRFGNKSEQPFNNLSDGQRAMLAMVGDIARRAATLNPHLGNRVLEETPGVVLIDELDLHLHPRWQRRVIDDLKRTFPKIQFFCTTHSPFLIQTLSSGDELVVLDEGGETPLELDNHGIEAIAAGIMGVTDPEASPRYMAMLAAAKGYLAELDEATRSPQERLATYQESLAARLAPFASNPAFQAVLEMERLAKLGV